MARETTVILDTVLTLTGTDLWEWAVGDYEYSCRARDPFTLWLVGWDMDCTVAEASSLESAVRLSLRHAARAILARAGRATRAGRQQIEPGAARRLKP